MVSNTPLDPICIETTRGSDTSSDSGGITSIHTISVDTPTTFGIRVGKNSFPKSIRFTNLRGTTVFDPTFNAAISKWQPEFNTTHWYVATGGSDFNLRFGKSVLSNV